MPRQSRSTQQGGHPIGEGIWYIWQLPQNLAGLAFWTWLQRHDDGVRLLPKPLAEPKDKRGRLLPSLPEDYVMILAPSLKGGGISLGRYLFFSVLPSPELLAHERGHQIQSRKFGPLYLIVVGVPSLLRAIYHRRFHAHWSPEKRSAWYYGSWPESAADYYGGISR